MYVSFCDIYSPRAEKKRELGEEIKNIDDFFDNMTTEEFDEMLIRNGIEFSIKNSEDKFDNNEWEEITKIFQGAIKRKNLSRYEVDRIIDRIYKED